MILLAILPALVSAWVGTAHAQDKAQPKDRALVEACLRSGVATKRAPETCIGSVQGPCMKQPDGETTLGMKECGGREIAVWDERLNAAYKAVLASDMAKQQIDGARKATGAETLRDAQRAWISFRDRKCEAATLPMAGGTGAGLLSVDCYLQETARQALWLEAFGSQ